MRLIILPLILFFSLAFVSLFVRNTVLLSVFLVICTVANFVHSLVAVNGFSDVESVSYYFSNLRLGLGIEHRLDSFSAFSMFVVAFVALVCCVQFIVALDDKENDVATEHRHYLFFLFGILLAALNGLLLTSDLFNFYIFLELASITAYILTALNRAAVSKFAALYYLIIGGIASSLILLGIGLLYSFSGSLSMDTIRASIKLEELLVPNTHQTRYVVPFCFVVSGFVVKLGLFPFFRWIPLVYESLPPVISPFYTSVFSKVILSAFVIFMYRVFGFEMILNYKVLYNLLYYMFCVGIVVFSLKAIYEEDVRKVFAYSGMTQLSYMMLGLFLFVPSALIGSVVHLMHDAILKSGVMMMFWLNARSNNGYTIKSLGGFYERNPVLTVCFVVFSLALIGVPGTSGFISKLYILLGCIESKNYMGFVVLIAGALLNVIYFWKMICVIFFDRTSDDSSFSAHGSAGGVSRKRVDYLAEGSAGCFLVELTVIAMAFLSLLLGVYTNFSIGIASSVVYALLDVIGA